MPDLTSESPPAREAWIEISAAQFNAFIAGSPPAREAWIEIYVEIPEYVPLTCRLPQGRRGLKWQ